MAVTKARPAVKTSKARSKEFVLKEFERIAELRYNIAKQIYDHQDGITQEVIDRITERLELSSTGVVQFQGRLFRLTEEIIKKNTFYLAVDILADLALYDIQVANFKFHPGYCSSCKTRMTNGKIQKARAYAKKGK